MSLAKRAVWVIERRLSRPLSLAVVAAGCGVSRHHLAHAFGEATGYSIMEYVRARRLSEAAIGLAAGAGDVLQVALDAGYESHEAFTRAFKARFAVTPRDVRRLGRNALDLMPPLELPESGRGAPLSPIMRSAGEILAVGRGERFSFASTAEIPALWRAFGPEIGSIERPAQPIPIGIMADLGDDGVFTYVCAVEVTDFSAATPDLQRVRIAPCRYAVFQHSGHASELRQTYRAIWDEWFPQSGLSPADAPVIERHHPSFSVESGYGGLEIWAPIKDTSASD